MATEKPLASALQRGDRAACERLVLDQYEPIYGYFWWLSGSRETASDLTQETFLSAWKSLSTFDGRAPARVWIRTIASRVWGRHLRTRPPSPIAGLDAAGEIPDPLPLPDECAAVSAERERIRGAVRRLPEPYRQVVVLHYFQGLTQREVAAALGIAVGLVKWRINQSLRRLERMLGTAAQESVGAALRGRP